MTSNGYSNCLIGFCESLSPAYNINVTLHSLKKKKKVSRVLCVCPQVVTLVTAIVLPVSVNHFHQLIDVTLCSLEKERKSL